MQIRTINFKHLNLIKVLLKDLHFKPHPGQWNRTSLPREIPLIQKPTTSNALLAHIISCCLIFGILYNFIRY